MRGGEWKLSARSQIQYIFHGITLPTKVCLVKSMVFPVVMYGCESWTVRKLSTKELMLLNCGVGEDLRVPWTEMRSNQSILKEISPEYSLKGLMLEAETPILWPPDAKNWLIWKDPDPGKDWRREEEDDRGWDDWMASPTQWTWVWVNSRSWWWTGRPGMLQSMGSQSVGHDWATELNWHLESSLLRPLRDPTPSPCCRGGWGQKGWRRGLT